LEQFSKRITFTRPCQRYKNSYLPAIKKIFCFYQKLIIIELGSQFVFNNWFFFKKLNREFEMTTQETAILQNLEKLSLPFDIFLVVTSLLIITFFAKQTNYFREWKNIFWIEIPNTILILLCLCSFISIIMMLGSGNNFLALTRGITGITTLIIVFVASVIKDLRCYCFRCFHYHQPEDSD
jgi:hypothetical protein